MPKVFLIRKFYPILHLCMILTSLHGLPSSQQELDCQQFAHNLQELSEKDQQMSFLADSRICVGKLQKTS